MNKIVLNEQQIYFSNKNWDESFDELDSVMFDNMKNKNLVAIKKLYLEYDFTVRDICNLFEIEYNQKLQRLFSTVFGAKGYKRGGKRKGSGNKKGYNMDYARSFKNLNE